MIACVAFFVMLSTAAGYGASVTYKMFDGTSHRVPVVEMISLHIASHQLAFYFNSGDYWHRCTVATALGFPGLAFSIFFIVNTALWCVPFLCLFCLDPATCSAGLVEMTLVSCCS